jgi:hypothetical protein
VQDCLAAALLGLAAVTRPGPAGSGWIQVVGIANPGVFVVADPCWYASCLQVRFYPEEEKNDPEFAK